MKTFIHPITVVSTPYQVTVTYTLVEDLTTVDERDEILAAMEGALVVLPTILQSIPRTDWNLFSKDVVASTVIAVLEANHIEHACTVIEVRIDNT